MSHHASRSASDPSEPLDELNALKQEDEMLYNILAVDVWALAKTMDEFHPGFWAAFMKNRERSLHQFISEIVPEKPANRRRPPFFK